MSYPPVFRYAQDSTAVTSLLGTNPTRFWPFGRAPSPGEQGYGVPYSVHQLVYGSPENSLSCPPDTDLVGIQIDVYGKTPQAASSASDALRGAMEIHGHVVSLLGQEKDVPTGLYRQSFTVEFLADRSAS